MTEASVTVIDVTFTFKVVANVLAMISFVTSASTGCASVRVPSAT